MQPTISTGSAVVLGLVVTATVVSGAQFARAEPPDRGGATPDIEVRPESLRFTEGTDTRTLALRNAGNASLTVEAIAVVGPDRTAFGVAFDGPVVLEPGERRNVTVLFDSATPGSRFAMLHVLSDDPDEPQRNVWLTNTRTVADVSPSRVLEEKTLVNATVRNAEAGTRQSLNLSWPLTRDDGVAVDALSFVPERDGDITLSVATNASRFGDLPAFSLADGTESAGFLRVRHSIPNRDVRNVTMTLRVRKDLLAGDETGPGDVAVYRHEGGAWTELPTRVVGESDSHYFFEARASGLSDFVTGIKQAKFRITNAVVTVTRIRTDEGTEVLVRVRNVGGADGTYEVTLLLEEEVVDRRELSIAPNGTRQATFERSFDEPGTYEVYVNDVFAGSVTVDPSGAGSGDGEDAPGTDEDGQGDTVPSPGVALGILALAVVVALLVRARRRR